MKVAIIAEKKKKNQADETIMTLATKTTEKAFCWPRNKKKKKSR
jgi:hypothetical protein